MLEGLTPPVNNALCKVSREASKLSEQDQKILSEALGNPLWSTHALTKELNSRGFDVGETAMRKHREGECACARKSE